MTKNTIRNYRSLARKLWLRIQPPATSRRNGTEAREPVHKVHRKSAKQRMKKSVFPNQEWKGFLAFEKAGEAIRKCCQKAIGKTGSRLRRCAKKAVAKVSSTKRGRWVPVCAGHAREFRRTFPSLLGHIKSV